MYGHASSDILLFVLLQMKKERVIVKFVWKGKTTHHTKSVFKTDLLYETRILWLSVYWIGSLFLVFQTFKQITSINEDDIQREKYRESISSLFIQNCKWQM